MATLIKKQLLSTPTCSVCMYTLRVCLARKHFFETLNTHKHTLLICGKLTKSTIAYVPNSLNDFVTV